MQKEFQSNAGISLAKILPLSVDKMGILIFDLFRCFLASIFGLRRSPTKSQFFLSIVHSNRRADRTFRGRNVLVPLCPRPLTLPSHMYIYIRPLYMAVPSVLIPSMARPLGMAPPCVSPLCAYTVYRLHHVLYDERYERKIDWIILNYDTLCTVHITVYIISTLCAILPWMCILL